MKYRVLVSDYDDTLIDDEGNIPDINLAAIDKFIRAGGIFAINTGRMLNAILPLAKKFNLKGYLGTYQGGVIIDMDDNDRVVRNVKLSLADTVSQLKQLERIPNRHLHLYDMKNIYATKRDKAMEFYEKLSGVTATIVDIPLSEYAQQHNISANKLMMIGQSHEVSKELDYLVPKYPHLSYVLSKPIFLEILSPSGTKSAFINFLSEKFNLPTSQIAAVGDSLNDSDMIAAAGLGAAVFNANPVLKQSSDMILTRTNNQGAVAELIDYIMLDK